MSTERVPFEHPWDEVVVGDVADVVVGGTPSTSVPKFWGGTIPWMVSGDIHLGHISDVAGRITEFGLQSSNAKLVAPPAVAVALAGQGKTRGTVALTLAALTTNQSVALIKPRSSRLDTEYLYYGLAFRYDELRSRSSGEGRAGLSKGLLEQIPLPLPPIEEQTAIAEVLATVDRTIEQTEALIAKQRRIKAGLLHDLLTHGIDEHGNLRDPATHRFKESPVGLVPEGWEVDTIDNVAKQVTDGDHHTPKRSDSGVLLLSARNILDGQLDLTDVDFVSVNEYQRMIKRCFPEAGDVLISCSGTIGRVCLVPDNFRCGLVRSVALVKLDHDKCLPNYGEWIMRSQFVRKQIAAAQLQAAQPNLFQGAIRGIRVALPQMDEQQLLASILDAADDLIASDETHKSKLVQLKTGLMQDLLTGRVSVAGLINNGAQSE